MNDPASNAPPARGHLHVVGVAGVGMSALAQALLDQDYTVTGSDRFLDSGDRLDVLNCLERAGCRLVPQDGRAVTPATQAVVVSTAIEAGNADLDAATRCGVPVVHRAAMLARLVEGRPMVAVTGTAGKTTVTALIGWLLQQLGEDPNVVNGGAVLDWMAPNRVGSARRGAGRRWVIEADESDRSLLQFHPDWAVITNISKDHFDEAEVVRLFADFTRQVRTGIVCGPGVRDVLTAAGAGVGLSWHEVAPDLRGGVGGWMFEWRGVKGQAPMPGRHNALNAVLALELVHQLGHAPTDAAQALTGFRGVHRRLQVVREARGIQVVDDYAHNPAKLQATWNAVAETAPRVVGVWRPHGFRPLAHMFDELVESFASACRAGDRLFLLPVYYAGGTAEASVTSRDLAASLVARGVLAETVKDYDELRRRVRETLRTGDALLVMGARDPGLSRFAESVLDPAERA